MTASEQQLKRLCSNHVSEGSFAEIVKLGKQPENSITNVELNQPISVERPKELASAPQLSEVLTYDEPKLNTKYSILGTSLFEDKTHQQQIPTLEVAPLKAQAPCLIKQAVNMDFPSFGPESQMTAPIKPAKMSNNHSFGTQQKNSLKQLEEECRASEGLQATAEKPEDLTGCSLMRMNKQLSKACAAKVGRKQCDYDEYTARTRITIQQIQEEIAKTNPRDKAEIKRLKNKISAYESRIGKRSVVKDLKEKLAKRDLQLTIILNVIKHEVTPNVLQNIYRRICMETPASNSSDQSNQN